MIDFMENYICCMCLCGVQNPIIFCSRSIWYALLTWLYCIWCAYIASVIAAQGISTSITTTINVSISTSDNVIHVRSKICFHRHWFLIFDVWEPLFLTEIWTKILVLGMEITITLSRGLFHWKVSTAKSTNKGTNTS